jgi:heme-degrading monooxygenase HmoA
MYARIFSLHIAPSKMDDFIQAWREEMLPAAQQQKGWNGARLLVDREANKAMIIGFWQTEADAMATADTGSAYAQTQGARITPFITAPPVIEHYEIAAEA